MFKNEKPFEIIVLGPPVSGKGTQTDLIAQTFDVPHISTGVILHAIKTDAGNPLAAEVMGFMDQGQLVPTELVNRLVAERIKQADCKFGYAMDGFPRTLEQAQFLDQNADVDYVFLIKVTNATIIERMSGRRVCKNGHTWHLKYSPPKDSDICDTCGEPLFQRDDDKEETVRSRLAVYHGEIGRYHQILYGQGRADRDRRRTAYRGCFRQIVRRLVNDLRGKIGWK